MPTQKNPRSPIGAIADSTRTEPDKKTVLIVTMGMSPAVLTETVWALAHPVDKSSPVIPDEIEVITTQKCNEIFDTCVRSTKTGVWTKLRAQLIKDKNDKRLMLRACTLVETADADSGITSGKTDIRSSVDTAHTADAILGVIKKHRGAKIIASISGGRKSMSALLYGVMSVAGNRGDRIVHVVSDPRFGESPPSNYFFPMQGGSVTTDPKKGPVKTFVCKDMRSDLADLPFVPLGEKFAELRAEHADFASLVASITGEIAGKVKIRIQGTHMAFDEVTVPYAKIGLTDKNGEAMFSTLFLNADYSRKAKSLKEQVTDKFPEKTAETGGDYVSRKLNSMRKWLKDNHGWSDEKTNKLLPDLRKWATHRDHVEISP